MKGFSTASQSVFMRLHEGLLTQPSGGAVRSESHGSSHDFKTEMPPGFLERGVDDGVVDEVGHDAIR